MLIVLWECGNCAALFFFVLLKQLEKKERIAMGYQYTTGKVAASVTFLEPDLREELKKKAEDMGYAIRFIDRHLMDRDEISVREKEEQLEWLRDSEIILTSRGRFVDQTGQEPEMGCRYLRRHRRIFSKRRWQFHNASFRSDADQFFRGIRPNYQ